MSTLETESEAPDLLYVDLAGDAEPVAGKNYVVVPASSSEVGAKQLPMASSYNLSIDLLRLNAGDLPDLTKNNEATLTMRVDSQNPQDPEDEKAASIILTFDVRDYHQASGFLYRGGFTRVRFTNDVNLKFTLDEIDGQFAEGFKKVLTVLDNSGLMEIDAVKAFPYLDVVQDLASGLVETFKGKNDSIWAERVHLWARPAVGAGRAYLRTGIYAVVGQRADLLRTASEGEVSYRDRMLHADDSPLDATYVLMSIAVDPS